MNKTTMKILVTGSEGFIGKNLISHLRENNSYKICPKRNAFKL